MAVSEHRSKTQSKSQAKYSNVPSKFRQKEAKAKRVSFYRNGDYYDYGIHMPIQGQKHFQSMSHLSDYLTQKSKLPRGVRYIFTEEGRLISRLEDFEDGKTYIVSSTRNFVQLPYGAVSRVKTSHNINPLPVTDEDLRLIRPVTGKKVGSGKRRRAKSETRTDRRPVETRTITFVNKKDHSIRNTVLLNPNSNQPFEELLSDWGQSVKVPRAKKMLTPLGREVRSISQLKNKFQDVNTFYLDADDNEISSDGYKAFKKDDVSGRAKDSTSLPPKKPQLEWIHGCNGSLSGSTLHLLGTGEIAYPAGAIVVLYDRTEDRQRHYTKHTEDVLSVCAHPSMKAAASGQASGNEENSQAEIHVWNVSNLETVAVIGRGILEGDVVSITFSQQDYQLLCVESGKASALTLWDWESNSVLRRAQTSGDNVTGCAFHPHEDDLMVTFGMHHLTFWKRGKDGFLARKDALAPGHSGRTINSWVFLPDGSFAVGDTSGYITVWALSSDEVFYIEKEIKAHEKDVNALLLLPGGTLLSGGRSDVDAELRAWDTEDDFSNIAATKIPGVGGIQAMCPQKLHSDDGTIFIGTSMNTLLEGSVHMKFRILSQGHRREVVDLATNVDEMVFVTVDDDYYTYKWSPRALYWSVRAENDPVSVAIFPQGTVIVTGGSNGKLAVLNSDNGLTVSTIAVAFSPLSVLSYSSDGKILAIGSQDGNIYLYTTQNEGFMYKRSSVLKGENILVNIDLSLDNKKLQSVSSDNEFYELTVWDVLQERTLKDSVSKNIEWNEHTCTVGHNIIGIWKSVPRRKVVYLCCHKSSSGKFLACGDKDGFLRLFKYPCKEPEAEYHEKKQSSHAVTSVHFLSDNYLVSVGGPGGAVFIWKLS